MSGFVRDVRHSLRSLAAKPLFSAVVVLTLAVGTGTSTAIFTFFSGEMGDKAFQGVDRDRLFRFHAGSQENHWRVTYPDFVDYRRELAELGELYAWGFFSGVARLESADSDGGSPALFVLGEAVAAGHFEVYGAAAAHGRLLLPDDHRPGGERVAVLDHGFWQRRLGGDPGVVGRVLQVNGLAHTVVGIVPPGFQGHGMTFHLYTSLVHDAELTGRTLEDRDTLRFSALLRLREGVDRQEVEERLTLLAAALDRDFPRADGVARAARLQGIGESSSTFLGNIEKMLAGAVVMLLVLACVNVANLLLARAAGRQREIAVRAALGASGWRLARRLLTESVLLGVAGGGVGLGLAVVLKEEMARRLEITPTGLGGWGEGTESMPIDGQVLVFAFGLSVLTGVLFGLAPVVSVLRHDLVSALKGSAGGSGVGRHFWGRHSLVVVQVGVSTALLMGAALLAHSLLRLQRIDPGYETEHLLLAAVATAPRFSGATTQPGAENLPATRDARRRLYHKARESVLPLAGIEAATLVSEVPGTSGGARARLVIPELPDEKPRVNRVTIGPDFFATLDIPILRGRSFDERDHSGAPGVAVVNEAFVREYWPEVDDPVGRVLGLEGVELDVVGDAIPGDGITVIGIARDSRQKSRRLAPAPVVYLSLDQVFEARLTLVARTAGAPRRAIGTVRRVLQQVDPDLALIELDTHRRHLEFDLYLEVIFERLARLFGLFGLILAAAGIYSVMSCLVSYRLREMGIRLAVGATAADVVRLVLQRASWSSRSQSVRRWASVQDMCRCSASLATGSRSASSPLSTIGPCGGSLVP